METAGLDESDVFPIDPRQLHGYQPEFGYRVYTEKAIEIAETRRFC
ncbi:MAG: hypothetical protein ACXVJY_14205 [Ilumatobacteraceae bacterium]